MVTVIPEQDGEHYTIELTVTIQASAKATVDDIGPISVDLIKGVVTKMVDWIESASGEEVSPKKAQPKTEGSN